MLILLHNLVIPDVQFRFCWVLWCSFLRMVFIFVCDKSVGSFICLIAVAALAIFFSPNWKSKGIKMQLEKEPVSTP
ncbi:hypothetical protein DPMN_095433 [Dreissena polymorpha]|uniref:Uncharacterized protein n=1 Tax=Dreissena polymorpha TaxID=45954 RepID=A0A9D4L9C0_DREPO|nr:hypothetical protein DPMN_095433 [Dreissena polymorpha]